jgi:iron complex outermembrane recepter protein
MRIRKAFAVGTSIVALTWHGAVAAQTAPASESASPPAAAQTQDAPGTPEEQESEADSEIIVTGVRQSLQAGIELKRNNPQFVDAIVAEDIGKLPDTNVAESLQRVSGVQVSRGIGEGTGVTIRGIRRNLTLLNGRSIVDVEGRGGNGLDQVSSGSYGLLSSIPAELIARLEVAKQAGADQIEGGVGGTIDIITRRPLDSSDRMIAGSAQIGTNDRWGKASYRGSILYSDSFADDSFGLLVNAVYAKRFVREDSFNSFNGYRSLTTAFNTNPSGVSYNPNGDAFPGSRNDDFRYQRIDDNRTRLGITAVAQWKPTDQLELMLETFYARTESDRDRNWLSFSTSANGTDYDSVVLSPSETLVSGVIRQPVVTQIEVQKVTQDFITNAFSGRWESGALTVSGEVAYTYGEAYLEQLFARLATGTVAAPTAFPIAFDLTAGEVPSITLPSTLDLTNPANFVYTTSQDNIVSSQVKDLAARLDFTYAIDSGLLKSFQFGARYADTDVERVTSNTVLSFRRAITGIENTVSVFHAPGFLEGVPDTWLAPDRDLFAQGYGCRILQAPTPAACTVGVVTPGSSYTVKESSWAGYAKLNFGFDLGSIAANGNIGVRYVETATTSTGSLVLANGTVTPNIAEVKDGIWLPSAVVKLDLTDRLVARLGAARVSSRPNTGALNNGLSVNGVPSGSGGNPYLDPFTVDQADVSLEWYFGQASMVSMGLFYKDVKSFVVTRVQNETVPGFASPIPVTRQTNGAGGSIKGIELLYQQPFTFLPEPLDGLGIAATYTYIDSITPLVDLTTGQNLPIEGLSKNNANLILYYEKGPISLRGAINWRDKYFSSIGLNNAGVFFDAYTDLSATAKYSLTENFEIELEAANLLDDGVRRYAGLQDATQSYAVSGRQYNLTLRAKF